MPELVKEDVQIAVLTNQIEHIRSDINEIKQMLITQSAQFVTKGEFQPIKMIVFGMVGTILLSFLGGLTVVIWKT